MSTSINVPNVVANVLEQKEIASSSRSVLRRSLVEYLPTQQTDYAIGGNEIIRIPIAGEDMLIGPESFLQFKIVTTINDAQIQSLDEGGAHTLFKSVEIRTLQTGSLIQRYDNYNRYYALKRSLNMDEHDVAISGYAQGDDYEGVDLLGTGAKLFGMYGYDEADRPLQITRFDVCATGAAVFLTCRLHCSFLDHNIPLWIFSQGFEIVLELEHPDRIYHGGPQELAGNVTAANAYTISNVRYMASLITPSQSVRQSWISKFESNEGVQFSIPSVRVRRVTSQRTQSNDVITMNVGLRSVKKVYTVLNDQYMSEITGQASVRLSRSLSTYIRSLITSYQYKAGSMDFPYKKVECTASNNQRLMQHLIYVSGSNKFAFMPSMGLQDVELLEHDPSGIIPQTADCTKFIMAADLSRFSGEDDELCGLDLSQVPLQLELERSNTYDFKYSYASSQPVYYCFLEHDAILVMNRTNLAVLQ
jgi:hypothetical protein